ncbi:hypothetical protein [Sphingosinicella sp.]|uniref:hypothetical protein n=1 Tax=Sphingosinicella sp. TaxID=1917971 RepID=UPI00403798CD
MRTRRPLSLLLFVCALPACAQTPTARYALPLPSNSPLLVQAMNEAARQVRRCYRAPRVATHGRRIVTQLRVRINPDGVISGLPAIIGQSGVDASNQVYADRMAQAAIESVLRCAPLVLPPEAYRGTAIVLDLTFSPSASA